MRAFVLTVLSLFLWHGLLAQQQYHVDALRGSPDGDGSTARPWDLQTALTATQFVKPGDTIWLHEGTYNGRFNTSIQGTAQNKILVSAYKDDKVVLNGNVNSSKPDVLRVQSSHVIFKNFEITCQGNFSRHESDPDFQRINGLIHLTGEDCEFINLKIYNNPGLGVGSWKHGGGSIFDGCFVFNNGYIAKNGKGTGEGFYVQNHSNKTRVIRNCTIFNNYYKGIEVWSANKRADRAWVKHVDLINNVVFNNGSPVGKAYDNIIVATNDRNGINIAQHIKLKHNILYHNTNYMKNEVNGDAPSLTLGYVPGAPVRDIEVDQNIILGRNNALRILYANDLKFTNNIVYSGYVMQTSSTNTTYGTWHFDHNSYFTKNSTPFFITKKHRLRPLAWQNSFGLDPSSTWQTTRALELDEVLDMTLLPEGNAYRVVLFQKEGQDVKVDFSAYAIPVGTPYRVKNIEDDTIITSGKVDQTNSILLNMGTQNQTASNFGVYIVDFESKRHQPKRRKSFFKRLFGWLF